MITTLENPVEKVFVRWKSAIEKIVGKGNCSMSQSRTLTSEKTKYARMLMLGNPIKNADLEGNESITIPSFQIESFASGTKALSNVYAIDDVSHKEMVNMGFRRTYGPYMTENKDGEIARVVSRYTMLYNGKLNNQKVIP